MDSPKIRAERLNLFYGDFQALKDVNLEVAERRITALIGPSGCGKSTLLRTFNRMNDLIVGARVEGQVELDGRPLYGAKLDIDGLRKRVGMVFQRPNPFPLSVYKNVAYGPRVHGLAGGRELDAIVEKSLHAVGLWESLRDRLDENALHLSGERTYEVPPLSLPDPSRLPEIEALTQYEAVALFIERAQATKAGFAVTNENGARSSCTHSDTRGSRRMVRPFTVSAPVVKTRVGTPPGPERSSAYQTGATWGRRLIDRPLLSGLY